MMSTLLHLFSNLYTYLPFFGDFGSQLVELTGAVTCALIQIFKVLFIALQKRVKQLPVFGIVYLAKN